MPTPARTSAAFAAGQIIREPAGSGPGYWAGAPGAFYAADEKAWYLTYRLRRPRGVAPDRGGEARIARSTDLAHWDDVWTVTKDRYDSASIERSAIRKGPDGQWRYFTSYVDPADGRWCTAMMKAAKVEQFDPAQRRVLFTAAPLGLEGVKDPWIIEREGVFNMFLSVAVPTPRTTAQSHATLDIFNTGECVSATGLATSRDLEHWEWQGVVFKPSGRGWDSYCRRLSTAVSLGGLFYGFYDGSASETENYEEKTGAAIFSGLRDWQSLSAGGPLVKGPHASGSIRYMDAHTAGNEQHVFYEFARADGAHDLRLARVPLFDVLFSSAWR